MVYAVVESVCPGTDRASCAVVVRSVDGGRRWSRLSGPPGRFDGAEIAFADRRTGWLVALHGFAPSAHGTMYATRDGGAHWRPVTLGSVSAVTVSDGRVYAVTKRGLYAARARGGGFVRIGPSVGDALAVTGRHVYNYRTLPRNSRRRPTAEAVIGNRATSFRLPCDRGTWSDALTETASRTLLAACGGPPGMGEQLKRAYLSTDGGDTWRRVADPSPAGYVDEALSGAGGIFLCGGRMDLERSPDDGQSWKTAIPGDSEGVLAGGFTDNILGWAVATWAPGRILLSDDGGRTWRRTTVRWKQ